MTIFRFQDVAKINEDPKIYNYVSSVESPLTWGSYIQKINVHYQKAPPLQSMWYMFYVLYTNLWVGKMLRFVLHRIPAGFMDISLIICGRKPR